MNSTTWKNWITQMDFKSCLPCRKNHGKIYFVTYDHYHTFVEIIQGGIVNGI